MHIKKFANGEYYLVKTRHNTPFRAFCVGDKDQRFLIGKTSIKVPEELLGKPFRLKIELVKIGDYL